MTPPDDRQFPDALSAALAVAFDYGKGVDFEPFAAFLSAKDTTELLRDWTGNGQLSGDAFRVFGEDGSGGFAAIWLILPGRPLVDQPVVFLGSEGETGVIARDLGDFLWLLAAGLGPCEAATLYSPDDYFDQPNQAFAVIAEQYAADRRQSAATVIERARHEFPGFDDTIRALCR